MEKILTKGEGRTCVSLRATNMGDDIILYLFNDKAHLGAVVVAEYDDVSGRASTSTITRIGHKDDAIAQRVAHSVCKFIKGPVCVIAGVHLDDITGTEIAEIVKNADALADEYTRTLN